MNVIENKNHQFKRTSWVLNIIKSVNFSNYNNQL